MSRDPERSDNNRDVRYKDQRWTSISEGRTLHPEAFSRTCRVRIHQRREALSIKSRCSTRPHV